jgi:alanine dehydrogenase
LRVLSRADVETLHDLDQLVDAVASAIADLSNRSASMPPRIAARVAQQEGILGEMPAYRLAANALAARLATLFPKNPSPGLASLRSHEFDWLPT